MTFNTGRLQCMLVFGLCVAGLAAQEVGTFPKILCFIVGAVLFMALCFGDFDFDETPTPEPKRDFMPEFVTDTILKWTGKDGEIVTVKDQHGVLYLGFRFKVLEGHQFWLYTRLNAGQKQLLNEHRLLLGETFRDAEIVWLDETNYDNTDSYYTTKINPKAVAAELPVEEYI